MAILVAYYHRYSYPMRTTLEDHIFALDRYSDASCCFLNLAFGIPKWVFDNSFDLLVLHTTFLAQLRWREGSYEEVIGSYRCLKEVAAPKAVIPQDEFLRSDLMCRLIKDFEVEHLFTCAAPSEWQNIYRDVDVEQLNCQQLLTGYLTDKQLQSIASLEREEIPRSISIGYRAWHAEPWLGRHGMLKTQIAEAFDGCIPDMDISTRPEDTFLGLDWYRFLLRCKYTIGCEGGSSLLDYDGSLRSKVNQYQAENPSARFGEVEAACFPGLDGNLNLKALSPRHLEACATRTCQILVEGEYNGVLEPNKHYIPLRPDFSNLQDVLDLVKKDELREEIVDRAYNDIVKSGKYTYTHMVEKVLAAVSHPSEAASRLGQLRERLLWYWIPIESAMWQTSKKIFPNRALSLLRKLKP